MTLLLALLPGSLIGSAPLRSQTYALRGCHGANGWPTRSGTSRARRRARTGSATASSPRILGQACGLGTARAKPTANCTVIFPGPALALAAKITG